jgi:acyl transferase domain-containing protein/NADPH:quinone reductase-like Zn-dependent oxidoreductase/acyl carrier protein
MFERGQRRAATCGDEIAVVGIGCRLPAGANDPRSLWQALLDRTDAIVDVPKDRWDNRRFYDPDPSAPGKTYARQGGFLRESPFDFDADFFGISPREAAVMDPQQRLLLEVTWEALEDAGVPLSVAQRLCTGVFVGAFCFDNQVGRFGAIDRGAISASTATSGSMVMLSNRISYVFDFCGPSLTVDTACSSSLVAIHLACRSLQDRESDLAVAGGVNVMLRPENAIAMSKGGFLSPTCRCHAFDAAADGYVRGEGAGVVILKPLAAAIADDDPVYATIVATGVNQDGHTDAGISVPNGAAQERLIREVWDRAEVPPAAISYIEAHGTGTQAGDPIEAGALGAVFGGGRASLDPVWLGSAKTNFGHLEAGAGVLGLIKAALVLAHGAVPPNLHFERPNRAIDFDGLGLRVPTRVEQLAPARRHYAAVNSFGYGGTNAHAVLGSRCEVEQARSSPDASQDPRLVPLSAHSDGALAERAAATASAAHLLDLDDIATTLQTRRTHHEQRLAVWASSNVELADLLSAASHEERDRRITRGTARLSPRPLLFVYTGMGAQSEGMGSGLFAAQAPFREAIEEFDASYARLTGESLLPFFRSRDGAADPITNPRRAQPTNLALQIGLTRLWAHYGVTPDAVIGHSVGEIAAAFAAGGLTLDEAVRICVIRCTAQEAIVGRGTMMAVGLSASAAQRYLDETSSVAVAAMNAPDSITVAGPADELDRLARQLEADGAFHRRLRVAVAYHHVQQDAVGDTFRTRLGAVDSSHPTIPLYSTVLGRQVADDELGAAHWWNNVRLPVRFDDAMRAALGDGYDLCLEVGPHRVLAAGIASIARAAQHRALTVSSLQRGGDEVDQIRGALAELWVNGATLDWGRIQHRGRHVSLGSYPWQRMRVWQQTDADLADRIAEPIDPLLHRRLATPEAEWTTELTDGFLPYLRDHVVAGTPIFPAAGYLSMALAAAADSGRGNAAEAVRFERSLSITGTTEVRLSLDDASGEFALHARSGPMDDWQRTGGGRLCAAPPFAPRREIGELSSALEPVDTAALYDGLASRQLNYGPAFRAAARTWGGSDEVLAELALPADVPSGGLVHPVLLDAAIHTLFAASALAAGGPDPGCVMPVRVGRVRVHGAVPERAWSHGRVYGLTGRGFLADIAMLDDGGNVLVELERLQCQRVAREAAPARSLGEYVETWHAQPRGEDEAPDLGEWLVICGDGALAEEVAAALQIHGRTARIMNTARFSDDEPAMADGAVYLADEPADGGDPLPVVRGALGVISALQRSLRRPRRTVIVTNGAFAHGKSATAALGAVWGLGRVAQNESPELGVRLVDRGDADVDELVAELVANSSETEVRLAPVGRAVPRVERRFLPETTDRTISTTDVAVRLAASGSGGIDGLGWVEADRRAPGRGEVEIDVRFVPVNFKDLMKVMNLLSADYLAETFFATELGMEVAGVIARIGPDVSGYSVGDEVVVPVGGFSSSATVSTRFLVHRPRPLLLEQSPILINAMTAIHALVHLARVQPGERVLVSSGAGGVGLTAIALARHLGAEVFTTAGSPEKRQYLRDAGVEHVFDSRTLEFADSILARTGGTGVDVVLNSLSGEALRRSWEVLAPYGRFVEIGKRDIEDDTPLRLGRFDQNRSFLAMDIDRLLNDRPDAFRRLQLEAWKALDDGTLPALPVSVFDAAEVVDAFRTMARGRQIGKLVVSLEPKEIPVRGPRRGPLFRSDRSYLITGGLGGLGCAVARWLAVNGAGHLVLVGRRAIIPPGLGEELTELGAHVTVMAADVSDGEAVRRTVATIEEDLAPLAGVFHAAMVLEDALIGEIDDDSLARVLAPKAAGAWNLHVQTRDCGLEQFVLFSSVSALIGNPGQGSYAAANAYLDALARHRRARGLPALSVQWGAIDDVGVVAANPILREHLGLYGVSAFASADGLAALIDALRDDAEVLCLADVDWTALARVAPVARSPRFAEMGSADAATVGRRETLAEQLQALDASERAEVVQSQIVQIVSRVTELPVEMIRPDKSLRDMGVDSLMSVELAADIEMDTGVSVASGFLIQGPTIGEIANQILIDLLLAERHTVESVDTLSDEEATALLETLVHAGAIDSEALGG